MSLSHSSFFFSFPRGSLVKNILSNSQLVCVCVCVCVCELIVLMGDLTSCCWERKGLFSKFYVLPK